MPKKPEDPKDKAAEDPAKKKAERMKRAAPAKGGSAAFGGPKGAKDLIGGLANQGG